MLPSASHLLLQPPPCTLQDLNPLPFTVMTANCVGWVAYSYVTQDALVYWPNALGFMLGMFYTLSCYGLAGGLWKQAAAVGWGRQGGKQACRAALQ